MNSQATYLAAIPRRILFHLCFDSVNHYHFCHPHWNAFFFHSSVLFDNGVDLFLAAKDRVNAASATAVTAVVIMKAHCVQALAQSVCVLLQVAAGYLPCPRSPDPALAATATANAAMLKTNSPLCAAAADGPSVRDLTRTSGRMK